MKRILLIITPENRTEVSGGASGVTLLDTLHSADQMPGEARSEQSRSTTHFDWKKIGHALKKCLHSQQNSNSAIHILGSRQTQQLFLDAVKSDQTLPGLLKEENVILHLHSVIREQTSADTLRSEMNELADSNQNIILSTFIGGQYAYALSNRWEFTEKYYRMLIFGEGKIINGTPNGESVVTSGLEPLVNEAYPGMQSGDSLLIIPTAAGEFEQIYRVFHRKRFAPFERTGVRLQSIHRIQPDQNVVSHFLSRFASLLNSEYTPLLTFGSMDDYFRLTDTGSSGSGYPEREEDRIFFSPEQEQPALLLNYINKLSEHISTQKYSTIITALPGQGQNLTEEHSMESVNQTISRLVRTAGDSGYVTLFCKPSPDKLISVYQLKDGQFLGIPGETVEDIIRIMLKFVNS